jgi:hypothetical protein
VKQQNTHKHPSLHFLQKTQPSHAMDQRRESDFPLSLIIHEINLLASFQQFKFSSKTSPNQSLQENCHFATGKIVLCDG